MASKTSADTGKGAPHFVIELVAEPPGPDAHGRKAVERLRLGLKRLMRWYGLRVVKVAEVPDPAARTSASGARTSPPAGGHT